MKRYCDPSKDFLNSCRDSFIAKICQEMPAPKANRFSLAIVWLKYGLGSLFSLILIGSGAVVYADKANVDYNNPLYNFKRLAESIRITIAPVEQLPVLHTELAQRRLDEIKKIEADVEIMTKNMATTTEDVAITIKDLATTTKYVATTTKNITAPKKIEEKIKAEQKKRQGIMSNLRIQMRKEVNSVMNEIEQKRVEKTSAQKLCNSVSQIMKEDEQTDGGESESTHVERWNRLQKNCGEFIKIDSSNIKNSGGQ